MGMVIMLGQMEQLIQGNGKRINSMVKELIHGPMEECMRDNF
jgi:hypothetical protein